MANMRAVVTGRIYDEMKNGMPPFFSYSRMEWIRIEFEEFDGVANASSFEDPRVQPNINKFQSIITHAKNAGLKVLGIVGANAMPNSAAFPYGDGSIASFVAAVKWHLDAYSPRIDAIQVWNEPGWSGQRWNHDLSSYARALISVYSLKAQYPNVLFVAPGTPNAERGDWLRTNMPPGTELPDPERSIFNCTAMQDYRRDRNGKLPLDVIGWMAYGDLDSSNDPEGIFYQLKTFNQYLEEILAYEDKAGRRIIKDKNVPAQWDYPVWFIEYGWSSQFATEEQARVYFEKLARLLRSQPQVQFAFWYSFRDDEPAPGSENKRFGLRTSVHTGNSLKRVGKVFLSNNTGFGLFTPDGVAEWTIDEIVVKFMQFGGASQFGRPHRAPGSPTEKAHYWGPNDNGVIQQFIEGQSGEGAFTMIRGSTQVWLLRFGFYQYYMNGNGPYAFGWPLSDEYVDVDGATYQRFEKGTLRWKNGEGTTWLPNPSWTGASWSSLGRPSNTTLTSHPGVGMNPDGRLEVFARGNDSKLYHCWQTAPNGPWSGWGQLEVNILGQPAVRAFADGKLGVFFIGPDNELYYVRQNASQPGWSSAFSLGKKIQGMPALQVNLDGRLEIFVQDVNNQLWHIWQVAPDSAGWGPWKIINFNVTGLQVSSTPAAARNQDARLEVFVRGTDGQLWHAWQPRPNSVADTDTSQMVLSLVGNAALSGNPATANGGGTIEIFWVGPNNDLRHTFQTAPNSRWNASAVSLGGNVQSRPGLGRALDGRLEVFVRGLDNLLYQSAQRVLATGSWSPLASLGGNCMSGPVAATNQNGRMEAFVIDNSGGVSRVTQT